VRLNRPMWRTSDSIDNDTDMMVGQSTHERQAASHEPTDNGMRAKHSSNMY